MMSQHSGRRCPAGLQGQQMSQTRCQVLFLLSFKFASSESVIAVSKEGASLASCSSVKFRRRRHRAESRTATDRRRWRPRAAAVGVEPCLCHHHRRRWRA